MKYKEVYDKVEDNLLNDETIKKCLKHMEIYGANLYSFLSGKSPDSNTKKYNGKDNNSVDMLKLLLFNSWKNAILNLNDNEIKNNYDEYTEIIELRKELQRLNKNVNIEELNNFIANLSEKHKIILEKHYYAKNYGNVDNGWLHIYSYKINGRNKKDRQFNNNIQHRLYINIDSKHIEKFLYLFTKKNLEMKIPFYYKYNDNATNLDSILIYTNNEFIIKHYEIIDSIIKENNDIDLAIENPPLGCGVIGKIGYGSEMRNHNSSFNQERANLLGIFISNKDLLSNDKNIMEDLK